MAEPFRETTVPLMTQVQVDALIEEKRRLEVMTSPNLPPHIANAITDRGGMTKEIRRINKDLAEQAPSPYDSTVIDAARARMVELENDIGPSMQTARELRANPPGAVDRLIQWEKDNKSKALELKNIRRRMLASGDDSRGGPLDVGNLESLRPKSSSNELNRNGAQVATKDYLIPPNVEIRNVMSDADRDAWQAEKAAMRAEIMAELKAEIAAEATPALSKRGPGRPPKDTRID